MLTASRLVPRCPVGFLDHGQRMGRMSFYRAFVGFYRVLHGNFEEAWLATVYSHLKHLVMFKTISNKKWTHENFVVPSTTTSSENTRKRLLGKNMETPSPFLLRAVGFLRVYRYNWKKPGGNIKHDLPMGSWEKIWGSYAVCTFPEAIPKGN